MDIATKFEIGERVLVRGDGFGTKIFDYVTVVTISQIAVYIDKNNDTSIEYRFCETDKVYYEETVSKLPTLSEVALRYEHKLKIKNIKFLRTFYPYLGLKEAKEVVEAKIRIAEIEAEIAEIRAKMENVSK